MSLLKGRLQYKLLNAAVAVVFMAMLGATTLARAEEDQPPPTTPEPTTTDDSGDDTDYAHSLPIRIPL